MYFPPYSAIAVCALVNRFGFCRVDALLLAPRSALQRYHSCPVFYLFLLSRVGSHSTSCLHKIPHGASPIMIHHAWTHLVSLHRTQARCSGNFISTIVRCWCWHSSSWNAQPGCFSSVSLQVRLVLHLNV
jgi:hypothetical protein